MTKSVQLREKEALRKFLINRRSELGPSIDFQSNILNNIKPLIEELENEIKILKSDFMELKNIAGNISSQLDENIYTIKDILDS